MSMELYIRHDNTYLGDKTGVGHRRVQYVIDINWKKLEEALISRSADGVRGVISVCPCIGAVGEASIGKMVYDAFVGIFLGPHEDQMLKGMRASGVIEY